MLLQPFGSESFGGLERRVEQSEKFKANWSEKQLTELQFLL